MQVRCERCSTIYDFDEARIPAEGLAVQCTSCGQVFRAYARAPAHTGAVEPWLVRQTATGNVIRFKEMTTLQRWIVERKVSRADEISNNGAMWRRLGDIPELASFFQAVEAAAPPAVLASAPSGPVLPSSGAGAYTLGSPPVAAGPRWEASPQALPRMQTGSWQIGGGPPGVAGSFASAQTGEDDDLDFGRKRGAGTWIVLTLLLVVVGGAGALYVLRPALVRDLVARVTGRGVNELAARQVEAAYLELAKDTYASIERARTMFEKAVSLDGAYAAARAGSAQAELARAEYLAEEVVELEAKIGTLHETEHAAVRTTLDERKAELRERLDRASAEAKEAMKLEPESAEALRVMADYYRLTKAPDSMRPLLEKAREKAPADPYVAYVLGASVATEPALAERAIRHLDEALEAAPALHRARYRLARVFQGQKNEAKANQHVETILEAEPEHERAKALFVELHPPPPVAAPEAKEPTYDQLFARAERLRENDQAEKALELYERALELEPDDPDAHTGMGWCYLDLEQAAAAVTSFKRALQLSPRLTDAHFGVAEAYRTQGNKREAEKYYRQYLDILPDGPDAPVAKRMLEQLR